MSPLPIPVDVGLAQEAVSRAVQEILDILEALQDRNVGTGGVTFGTTDQSREDRILMFLDDLRSGALDHLKVLNIRFYYDYIKQYRQDAAASPQLRGVALPLLSDEEAA